MNKPQAVMDAIRKLDVGSDLIIHNEDGSVAYILRLLCKEHPEKKCKHKYRSDGRSYCYCVKCGKDKYDQY
jgi:hypothetical protein